MELKMKMPDLSTTDSAIKVIRWLVTPGQPIKVFGMEEGPGFQLAHHLGRALHHRKPFSRKREAIDD